MISTRTSDPATRHEQLRSAWALLAGGRFQDAGWAFGRILRDEPAHDEARRGRDEANSHMAESRRRADESLAEAEAARAGGDELAARRLAEVALSAGTDTERALGLLDRLAASPGAVTIPARPAGVARTSAVPTRGVAWSRVGFVSFWMLAFGLIAAGVATSWEQIVGRLASAPRQELRR